MTSQEKSLHSKNIRHSYESPAAAVTSLMNIGNNNNPPNQNNKQVNPL